MPIGTGGSHIWQEVPQETAPGVPSHTELQWSVWAWTDGAIASPAATRIPPLRVAMILDLTLHLPGLIPAIEALLAGIIRSARGAFMGFS